MLDRLSIDADRNDMASCFRFLVKSVAIIVAASVGAGIMTYYCSTHRCSRDVVTGSSGRTSVVREDSVLSPDGIIRHCVTRRKVGRIPGGVKKTLLRANAKDSTGRKESTSQRRKAFKKVFDKREWGGTQDSNYRGLQSSGWSAALRYAQKTIAGLHLLINQIKTDHKLPRVRLLDVPCGDMMFMSQFLASRDDVDYVGIDIVPDIIDNHRKQFSKEHPNWQFHLKDIVHDNISESLGPFHLVLVRHLLPHLFNADILRVLEKLSNIGRRQSTPAYLMATNLPTFSQNNELNETEKGRFHGVNLESPPFSLYPPLCLFNEDVNPLSRLVFTSVWRLPLYQVSGCSAATKLTDGPDIRKYDGESFYSCVNWSPVNI